MTNLDSILKSRDITLPTKVCLVKALVFLRLSAEELMLLTVVLEKTLESPSDCKEIEPVHPEGHQSWVFVGRTDVGVLTNSNALATWWEEPTHWKRPWCWQRLKAGGEGDDRGWDGWMASLTQRTWVWVNSRSWWWTGRPGMLQFMGSQRVRHDWPTERKEKQKASLVLFLISVNGTRITLSSHISQCTPAIFAFCWSSNT